MKVAIPYWQGRVSPVLDVATRFLVVVLEAGREISRQDVSLVAAGPVERARELKQVGVEVVVCGVISRPVEVAMQSAGVTVIQHTCGPVEEVLMAFIHDQLSQDAFLMPGCCGRRQRFGVDRRSRGRCCRRGQRR